MITTKIITTQDSGGWSIKSPPAVRLDEGNVWYVLDWSAGEDGVVTPEWKYSISGLTVVPLLPMVLRHTHVLSVLASLGDVISTYSSQLSAMFKEHEDIEQSIYLGPVAVEEDLFYLPDSAIDVNKDLHSLSIGEFETVKGRTHDAVVYCVGCSAKKVKGS